MDYALTAFQIALSIKDMIDQVHAHLPEILYRRLRTAVYYEFHLRQSMQNSKELSALSKQLCDDCQDLHIKRRQLGGHVDPILDQALNRLATFVPSSTSLLTHHLTLTLLIPDSSLQKVHKLCQDALVKKPGKRNLIKYRIRSFFFSGDIRDQIAAAKADIRDARARFVVGFLESCSSHIHD